MTTKRKLEDLILAAASGENDKAVLEILDIIESTETAELREAASNFEYLFDSWEEAPSNQDTDHDARAKLCVAVAERCLIDTSVFRNALNSAIRKLLPPYFSSPSVVKAIGARDQSTSTSDATARLKKLQALKSTALVYLHESRSWGKVHNFDKITATVALSSIYTNSVSSSPVSSILLHSHFFDTNPEMISLLHPGKNSYHPAAEYKRMFHKHALIDISDAKLTDIIQALMVPSVMSLETFEAWWNEAAKTTQPVKRTFSNARSILELHTLLKPIAEAGEPLTITEADAEKLSKLFKNLRSGISQKDMAMLAEAITYLASADAKDTVFKEIFMSLRGKAPFWPTVINEKLHHKDLEMWGRISVKQLSGFIRMTSVLYSEEELALLSTFLPLRCLTPLIEKTDPQILYKTLNESKIHSSDLVLWIWRNRTKVPPQVASSLDMDKVVAALSLDELPKEWLAAQRELKKILFEKADFQKFIIENADGDIPSIINALQKYRKFQHGERQSIMVKLSRHSDELKDYIESGEGKKMMGVQAEKSSDLHPPLTSVRSLRRLQEELDNLIKVQIPENVAAVALARSYGDLRENAEYDAAKERRRFLHKRRSELEKTLSFIAGTDFKDVTVKDTAILGSLVKLESATGAKLEYYLLGAWDGDPEHNCISYKTKIGEELLGKKVSDTIQIPEKGLFTVKEILPLPEKMRKTLADET